MALEHEIVDVPVEDVRRGDELAMTSEDDPRPQVFHVADVESVHEMAAGQVPRIVLTSEPAGDNGEALVLEYPTGTLMRKIVTPT